MTLSNRVEKELKRIRLELDEDVNNFCGFKSDYLMQLDLIEKGEQVEGDIGGYKRNGCDTCPGTNRQCEYFMGQPYGKGLLE